MGAVREAVQRQGVDAQIFAWDVANDPIRFESSSIADGVQRMRQSEFKVELGEHFNHSFYECDSIVVFRRREPPLVNVTDTQNNVAEVMEPPIGDALEGIGFYLDKIRNGMRIVTSRVDRTENLKVPVIEFSKLVDATFTPFANVSEVRPCKIFKTDKQARARPRRSSVGSSSVS